MSGAWPVWEEVVAAPQMLSVIDVYSKDVLMYPLIGGIHDLFSIRGAGAAFEAQRHVDKPGFQYRVLGFV